MTALLTLAEVQALSGFTDGPWRMSIENGGGVVAGHRHAIVSAYSSPLGWPCTQVEQASRPLVLAAPALHATCLHLHAEVERLRAHNARMAEFLSTLAECMPGLGNGYALDAAIRKHAGWEPAGVGGQHKADWIGALAAGEVDDG